MGSGTHCSKTDGFPGTHGTHANGATEVVKRPNQQSLENPTTEFAIVKGMRAPFLAVGGDTMFRMLNRYGLIYDSSMSVPNPSWPYTLDYKQPHTCAVKPCPTESHPGM